MALTASQLNTVYQNVLFRNADTAGIQFYANRSDISDAQVRQQIELSPEASIYVTPIVRLYAEVLGRVPDTAGLRFFSTQLRAGSSSIEQITQQFLNSSEFTSKTTATAGAVDATDLSNISQLVTDAYTSILGRQPGASEISFYQGRTPASILSSIAASPEAQQANAAAVTTYLDSAAQGTPNTGSLNNQTGAGGTGSTTNPGQQINFTATVGETLTGTTGDDVFSGVLDATAANSTFNIGDTANGGAGNDTLNLTVTSTTTIPAGSSISNIETINLNYAVDNSNLGPLNSSSFTGATLINQIDTTKTTSDFQSITVGTGVAAGFQSTGAFDTAVATGVNVTAATAAQTDISIVLNGVATGSAVAVVGAGLTTENVSGSGVAGASATTTGTLALTGTNTVQTLNLNLSGSETVTLTTYGGLKTIASTGAGGLTIDTSGFATLTSETYGGGKDVITTNVHNAAATLNVGGGADTVKLALDGTTATTTSTLSITLGAGGDTVQLANGAGLGNVTANTTAGVANTLVTITDFVTSQDTFSLGNKATALANQNTINAAVDQTKDLATNLKAVATAAGAGNAAEFVYGGDLYVFADTGAANAGALGAGDTVVKLTGVTTLLTVGQNLTIA